MKTQFERTTIGTLGEVNAKSQEKRYTITLIRPGDSDEVSMEMIAAPGSAAAFMTAQQFFPGAQILSVEPVPDPLPVRAAKDAAAAPGARFIRGMFRPTLSCDENDLTKLND